VVTVLLKSGESVTVKEKEVARFVKKNRAAIRHKTCPACQGRETECTECEGQFVVPEIQ
jgi:hypothetical protein